MVRKKRKEGEDNLPVFIPSFTALAFGLEFLAAMSSKVDKIWDEEKEREKDSKWLKCGYL
jgi:hypothetical protein